MYKFTDEVNERFDTSTKEIADEIHEVSRLMSQKINQAVNEIKIVVELNGKEQGRFYA